MCARLLIAVFSLVLLALPVSSAPVVSLQAMIDAAKDGAIIMPPPGTYKGPIKITKPIVLD